MIEIVTLFLGLIHGPQIVELDVHPDVAAVEIALDGQTLERLDGPPWTSDFDLGTELRTHRLEAVALDGNGRELHRAVRLINLGHERQAGHMTLLEDENGRPRAVSLGWESIGQRDPVQVEMYFDGEPIAVENPREVPIPRFDPEQFHFVSAVLGFHNGGSDRIELGFGGRLGMEVSTELTALPVLPTAGERPPRKDDLANAFRRRDRGKTIPVHGVEQGRAEVVFVRDVGVQPVLDDLVASIAGSARAEAWLQTAATRSPTDTSPFPIRLPENIIRLGKLPRYSRLRLLAARAAPILPTGVSPNMFLISAPVETTGRGLLATAVEELPQQFEKQLALAVALAGQIAQGTNRPRAVVLILGDGGQEVGPVSVQNARDYLRDLSVPLFVWTLEADPVDTGWGDVLYLGPPDDLRAVRENFTGAVERLADNLIRQRVVWLKGGYLPREIELAPSVQAFHLAGRDDPDSETDSEKDSGRAP